VGALVPLGLIAAPLTLVAYAYAGYPFLLRLLTLGRPAPAIRSDPPVWPHVTISVPVYNEVVAVRGLLDSLLALDYPADRRQILIMSDASTDGTDDIVREYAARGVELLRMEARTGKTGMENIAVAHYHGEIIVNTDASIRIPAGSLRPLIRVFQDPTVGVASGRDVSVGDEARAANQAESGYVGYEMWIRALETRFSGIVGASGCFYAIRRSIVADHFPPELSRDFASCLLAREAGFRGVSVDGAVCLVPRAASLQSEFRRKVRTMARGIETLWYKRDLLNPWWHGAFAWMLWSHKLVRWLASLLLPLVLVGLALMAPRSPLAALALGGTMAAGLLGALAFTGPWAARPNPPRLLRLCGYLVGSSLAALLAWRKALAGERNPIWEPTRRPSIDVKSGA
jgi:cellulose synthase/poly-beta-1,6-N-acetylglucosamine synthase-like glycosyltransferase